MSDYSMCISDIKVYEDGTLYIEMRGCIRDNGDCIRDNGDANILREDTFPETSLGKILINEWK
jgi:hypothetical protein